MRLGIFGGTFAPIHFGHLLLAEFCREAASLDRVVFVPAAMSPHKQGQESVAVTARVEMVQLAIAGHESFDVSKVEVERGGVSYTVDTLTHFRQQHADAQLFFLMGADSLDEFSTWKNPTEICRLAMPIVVGRVGSPKPNLDVLQPYMSSDQLYDMGDLLMEMPLIELSSTEIRRRISQRRSIRYQVPRAVEMYIESNKLYHPHDEKP